MAEIEEGRRMERLRAETFFHRNAGMGGGPPLWPLCQQTPRAAVALPTLPSHPPLLHDLLTARHPMSARESTALLATRRSLPQWLQLGSFLTARAESGRRKHRQRPGFPLIRTRRNGAGIY